MKKNILFLALLGDPTIPAGIPHSGGFNQTLHELITALAAFDFSIYVVTDISPYRKDTYYRISQNIELFRIPVTELERDQQENLNFAQGRILKDICKLLGKHIQNIALIHSFYWFSGHLAKCIHEQYNIPYIHTPISLSYDKISTGCQPRSHFQIECEPAFLQAADWILAITEQEAKTLLKHYHVDRSRIIVTGRSVDTIFHTPARDYSGVPKGVMVETKNFHFNINAPWWNAGAYTYLGRIVPIKGVSKIILAWEQVYQKHGSQTPPLWLVGGSPEQIAEFRIDMIKQTANLPFYESIQKIVWWGYLDQSSISALLLKTLLLVTHSRFEAGGRVILEAMCQGRPVIATPYGFAADYIQDWDNGFLVPYGDQALLAHRMEHFIHQPYLAAAMGAAARSRFQQIERDWNYIGIHKKLYRSYLAESLTTIVNESNMNLKTSYISRHADMIDVFPHRNIWLTRAEWNTELTAGLRHPITNFVPVIEPNHHARHFIAEIATGRFWIKQFYNRINEDSIWNMGEIKKVFGQAEQYYAADQSQSFPSVVASTFTCEAGAYYVLPEMKPVCPDYISLCDLVNKFCQKGKAHKPKYQMIQMDSMDTLEMAFDNLIQSTQGIPISKAQEMLKHLPLIRLLLNKSRKNAQFGINYGKLMQGHIFCVNNKLCLLPTCSWYWGEIGLDYANAALLSKIPPRIFLQQQDSLRMLLWYLFASWQNLNKAEWFEYKSPLFYEKLVHDTLDVLKEL